MTIRAVVIRMGLLTDGAGCLVVVRDVPYFIAVVTSDGVVAVGLRVLLVRHEHGFHAAVHLFQLGFHCGDGGCIPGGLGYSHKWIPL